MMPKEPAEETDVDRSQSSERSALLPLARDVFSLLSVGFGVAALAMIIGATFTPTGQVNGESLVLSEVQVLPGFYMKPITFFTFSLFLSFSFGLYSPHTRRVFYQANPHVLRGIYIVAWLVAMGSAFEILYHIVLWSASLAVQGLTNPDVVVNPFPVSANPSPINVVFASKIVIAIFFMSLFFIDYLRRIDRIRGERDLATRLIGARIHVTDSTPAGGLT